MIREGLGWRWRQHPGTTDSDLFEIRGQSQALQNQNSKALQGCANKTSGLLMVNYLLWNSHLPPPLSCWSEHSQMHPFLLSQLQKVIRCLQLGIDHLPLALAALTSAPQCKGCRYTHWKEHSIIQQVHHQICCLVGNLLGTSH